MSCVACIQMASGPQLSANLGEADRLIAQAVEQGAGLLVLPENFAFMGPEEGKLEIRETAGEGPIQEFLSRQAERHKVWLVGGTVPLACAAPDKVRAACMVFDDTGRAVARYDKVHLFDVTVGENVEERYTESDTIEPGDEAVVLDSPFGRLGLAVCYDLRFPELFRCMLERDVELVAVPSAFTAVTGKAHWEVLVRARAIENLCYVVAANQGGFHVGGRSTYGHSLIADPWGAVLDVIPRNAGVITAELDRGRLASIRASFPATEHRRFRCTRTGSSAAE